MLSEQRHKEIMKLLAEEGSIKTSTLCERLSASRETIRRDLESLEERGLLKRIHGGAVKPEPDQEPPSIYTSLNRERPCIPLTKRRLP